MTDHKDEATFHGGELPQRQPLDTFAQHGAPPEPPVQPSGERPWLAPGSPPWADLVDERGVGIQREPAPWGSLSQDIGHPAPKPRGGWRSWNPIVWVVIGVAAVLLICGIGSLVALGAGGKAVVDTVNEQATARAAEIKITSCAGPDEFGMVTVKYTIHNGSADAQSYLPQFDLGDGKGTVYGQAADIVNNLGAGKDYRGSAANVVQAPKGAKIVCSVASS